MRPLPRSTWARNEAVDGRAKSSWVLECTPMSALKRMEIPLQVMQI